MDKINKFDTYVFNKLIVYSHYRFLSVINVFGSIFIIPVLIIFVYFASFTGHKSIAVIMGISFTLNSFLTSFLKFTIKRKRFNKPNVMGKIDPYSFPSGHVNRVAGLVFCFYPYVVVQVAVLIFSFVLAVARMMRGYHFFSDCLGGLVIGLLISFLAFRFSFLYTEGIILFLDYIFSFIPYLRPLL